jgi:hypothetical protein
MSRFDLQPDQYACPWGNEVCASTRWTPASIAEHEAMTDEEHDHWVQQAEEYGDGYEPDPERAFEDEVMREVMMRHPDMAFQRDERGEWHQAGVDLSQHDPEMWPYLADELRY